MILRRRRRWRTCHLTVSSTGSLAVRANDPTLTIVKCPHWDDYCHTENILDGVRDMVWRAYMDYLVDLFVALQQNTQAKFLNLWMWVVGMKTIKSKTMTNGRNYRCAFILRVFLF